MGAAPVPAQPTTATGPARVAVAHFPNGDAWWDAIGQVPLDRVVFDPPPGTATIDDVVRLDAQEDRFCELVHGTLVEKTVGFHESQIAMRLGFLLLSFVDSRKLGTVVGEGGMLTLLPNLLRIPDVAFVARGRLAFGPELPPAPAIAPDLAVEVISRSNSRREMELKLSEYFESETRLVWYVYPETRTITVYTSTAEPVTLTEADRLTGGDVLPGFDVAVADVFDVG